MWFDLSNAEIDLIRTKLGQGPLVDKLSARPHQQTGVFTRTAEAQAADSDQKLFVDETGIIERHDFGAYVMTWMWVSDEDAHVPTSFEGFTVADELRDLFKNLPSFRITDLDRSPTALIAYGKMDDYEWKFEAAGMVWLLTAFSETGKYADWLHIEEWKNGTPSHTMSGSDTLPCIGRALQLLATNISNSRSEHHILWREYLELYAFGAIPAEEAIKWINVPLQVLDSKSQPLRARIDEMRTDGGPVFFAGPGIPRFDIGPESASG